MLNFAPSKIIGLALRLVVKLGTRPIEANQIAVVKEFLLERHALSSKAPNLLRHNLNRGTRINERDKFVNLRI